MLPGLQGIRIVFLLDNRQTEDNNALDSAAIEYLAAKQVKLPLDSRIPSSHPLLQRRLWLPIPHPAMSLGAILLLLSQPDRMVPLIPPLFFSSTLLGSRLLHADSKGGLGYKVERKGRVMDKAKIRAKTKARTNPSKVIGKDPLNSSRIGTGQPSVVVFSFLLIVTIVAVNKSIRDRNPVSRPKEFPGQAKEPTKNRTRKNTKITAQKKKTNSQIEEIDLGTSNRNSETARLLIERFQHVIWRCRHFQLQQDLYT